MADICPFDRLLYYVENSIGFADLVSHSIWEDSFFARCYTPEQRTALWAACLKWEKIANRYHVDG